MQGGKFDGNPRSFIDAATVRRFTDGVDSLLIRLQIRLRIFLGQCRFTQHVVGVAEPFFFVLAGVSQRFGNGFAGNKLLAHQAHRHVHAFADQRFAAFTDNAA